MFMRFLPKKSPGSAWLILFLAAILAVLGSLQYRSTEQVSEATARDMEESLQSALFDFRHALERELSSLCLALQSSGESSYAENPKDLAHRLNQWRQAEHPGLVTNVFLWDSRSSEPLLIAPTGFHKPSAWPPNLAGLPAELQNSSPEAAVAPGSSVAGEPSNKPLRFGKGLQFGWMLDQERLALLHPTFVSGEEGMARVVWLIVPLERQFLTLHLLPDLAKYKFGGHSEN